MLCETLCSAVTGNQSETHFRLAEFCIFSSYAHVTSHRQLAATTERKSVHSCNDGLRKGFDFLENSLAVRCKFFTAFGIKIGKFRNVSAGNKRFRARAGNDDAFYSSICSRFGNGRAQVAQSLLIKRVELIRTIDGNGEYAVFQR